MKKKNKKNKKKGKKENHWIQLLYLNALPKEIQTDKRKRST